MKTRTRAALIGLGASVLVTGICVFVMNGRPERNSNVSRTKNSTPAIEQEQAKVHLAHGSFDLKNPDLSAAIPEPYRDLEQQADDDGQYVYIVQFKRPTNKAMRESITTEIGGRMLGYVPDDAYLVRMTPEAAARAQKQPHVSAAVKRPPYFGVEPVLIKKLDTMPDHELLEIQLCAYEGERLRASHIRSAVADARNETFTVQRGRPTLRTTVARLRTLLPQFATVSSVAWTQEYRQLRLMSFNDDCDSGATEAAPLNDDASGIIQSGSSGSTPIWEKGITGYGQNVLMTDSGLDADHEMFWDANQGLIAPGVPNTNQRKLIAYNDVNEQTGDYDTSPDGIYHGTHVGGTVCGKYPGETTYQGMAPAAKIIVNDAGKVVEDEDDEGNPVEYLIIDYTMSIAQLFGKGAEQGSHISTNSWGTATFGILGYYDAEARDIDTFVHTNPNELVLFSAGNQGDLGEETISFQSQAKNIVCVGATGNGSTNGSGNGDRAFFSSEGPAADGRFRPHVMAPGYSVVSAEGDGMVGTPNRGELALEGTSMSCPATAGGALLIRQYFVDGFYPTGAADPANGFIPSAALMKAALINSGRDLAGGNFVDAHIPDNTQGWGRIVLDDVLYFDGDMRKLIAADNLNVADTGFTSTSRILVTSQGQPLRITVVWTDYPGTAGASRALVNDLNLEVTSPSGKAYRGNIFQAGQASENDSARDSVNTEECVYIHAPEQGTYIIDVKGQHLRRAPQKYALVMTGDVEEVSLGIESSANSAPSLPSNPIDYSAGDGGCFLHFGATPWAWLPLAIALAFVIRLRRCVRRGR